MTTPDFDALGHSAPANLLVLTVAGEIVYANQRARHALGGLDTKSFLNVAAEPPEAVLRLIRRGTGSRDPLIGSLMLRLRNGGESRFRCEAARVVLQAYDGPPLVVMRCIERPHSGQPFILLSEQVERLNEQIYLRQRDQMRLEQALAEQDALLREVHHRVKNNLQMMASMVAMMARTATPDAEAALLDVSRRIVTIGHIYNHIHAAGGSVSELDLAAYLRTICKFLVDGFATKSIALALDLESVFADVDTALPVGLITNELITNALKHAFPEGRDGVIQVRLKSRRGFGILTVQDNGVGFPRQPTSRFGLKLLSGLAGQIDGKLYQVSPPQGGSRFRVVFKMAARAEKEKKPAEG